MTAGASPSEVEARPRRRAWAPALAAAPIAITVGVVGLLIFRLGVLLPSAAWSDWAYVLPILVRTVLFAGVSAAVQTALGLAMALAVLLTARTVAQRAAMIACFFAPYTVPSVLAGLAYRFALGPLASLPLALQRWFGIPAPFWLTAHPMLAATLASIWQFSPFAFLLIYLALKTTSTRHIEAARIDGASGWKLLSRIVLPPIAPVLLAVFFLRLVFMLGKYETPFIFTKQVMTTSQVASVAIAAAYGGSGGSLIGGATSLAVALFLVSASVAWLYLWARRGAET